MAVNLTELIAAQNKLIQQDQKRALKNESITLAEFKNLGKTSKETVDAIKEAAISDTGEGLNSNVNKMIKEVKKTNTLIDKQTKVQLDTKSLLNRSAERKEFKSLGQRVGGIKEGFKDFFTMRGFLDKTGIVKRGTGGMFSNALDAREARQQKAQARVDTGERARYKKGTVIDGKKVGGQVMDEAASLKQFEKDAKEEQALRRKQGDLQRAVEKKTQAGNLNESQASQLKESKELKKLAAELKRVDPESYRDINNLEDTGEDEPRKSSKASASKNDLTETEIENSVVMQNQLDILTKIEENTRGEGKGEEKAGKTDKGEKGKGGLFSGIGDKMKGVGKALTDSAKGMLALAASVWIISKAFQNFAEVKFEDFMMGIGAIAAITLAVRLAGDSKSAMAFLALGASIWVISKAFQNFAELKWSDVLKGIAVIGVLALTLAGLALIGPAVLIGAAAMLVMAGAIWVLSKALQNIAETFPVFVDGLERLSEIGGASLIGVAAGIAAIGAAMVVFGTGAAIAGLANLVTNLLSIGQDSPLEQLEKISTYGPGIEKAASGLERMAQAMQSFAAIDEDHMEAAVDAAEKIAKSGAKLQISSTPPPTTGAQVYNNSAKNAGKPAAAGATSVVSAPTTINKQTKNIAVKQPIRNSDSSLNSYLKSRYAT